MSDLLSIRAHFMPVQPTVRDIGDRVMYREFLPAPPLQPYIYCYWTLQAKKVLEDSFVYRVVADGCIDIFFEYQKPEESFVMGFCRKYTEFALEARFHYVGIRFLPSMFAQLFKIDVSQFSDQFQPLHNIEPSFAGYLSSSLEENISLDVLWQKLDDYLTSHVANIKVDFDDRFYNALLLILKKQGVLQVESDLKTGLSPRQMRRKFKYFIGTTPKTFGKVVRFQNILRAKPSTQSLRNNKLFFDVGYYDQAHFIKEFKHLYGVSPAKAFGR